jgi:hypothetical protein
VVVEVGLTFLLPLELTLPIPVIEHPVALVADQVSLEDPPLVILVGLAERLTSRGGKLTVIVAVEVFLSLEFPNR